VIPRLGARELRQLGPPQLNMSYASLGLAAGTHPKVMAERLGHATVGITLDTYSHVAPALARRAADDLAALILGDGDA
jgi:integrase